MQQESTWLRLLRAEVKRTSLRKVEKVLGYSRTTIGLVLTGKYPRNLKRIEARVMERLKPPPKKRATKPPQLKQLDPRLHKSFKTWVELLTEKTVSEVIGIDQARVWPLIRCTDKHGAADVLGLLNRKLAEVVL